jgi:hypothetical protein
MVMGGFLALAGSSPGNTSGYRGLSISPDTTGGTVNTSIVVYDQNRTEQYLSANASVLSGAVNHIYVMSYVNNTDLEDILNEEILINGAGVVNLGNKDVRTQDYTGAWGPALEFGVPTPFNYSLNYSSTKSYTIQLEDLNNNVISTSATVNVYLPPSISISENKNISETGNNIIFKSAINNTVSGYTVNWSANGLNIGQGENISHAFDTAGNYTIQAVMTTGGTNYTSNTLTLRIVPKLEIVSLSQTPDPTDKGENATLTAQVSGGLGPYSDDWVVNDISLGINSTKAYYVFSSTGNYTVNFSVKDSIGDISARGYVETTTSQPSLYLVRSGTPKATVPYNMSVDVSGGNGPYSITWTFESGGTAKGANVSHVFDTAGQRTFEIMATDETGYTVYLNYTVNVSLLVSVSATKDIGIAPLEVSFTPSVSGGEDYTYSWNFGNNQVSSIESPSTTYGIGNYTLVLTVQSYNGATGESEINISALSEPLTLSYSPGEVNVTQMVHMTGTPAWWTHSPYSTNWTLPNGQVYTGFSLNYTFQIYTPVINVSASFTYSYNGIIQAYTGYLNVKMKPANISVSFTPPAYIPPETLIALNASAKSPDSNTFTYSYSIQGNIYLGNPQVYDFQDTGNYTVNLTVSDSLGAQKEVSRTIHVETIGLSDSIKIGYSEAFATPERTYTFNVSSASPVSFTELNFDGSIYTPVLVNAGESNGTYYSNYTWSINENNYIAGAYSIQFIVYSDNGASNSLTITLNVPNNGNNPFSGITDFIKSIGGPFVLLIGIATIIGGIASVLAISGRNTSEVVIGNVKYKSKPGKALKEVRK